jgi:glycine C-acetyltransferase
LFSNSLPTHIVAAYSKSMDILNSQPDLMNSLHSNVKLFREEMTKLGFEIMGNPQSAIVPVLLRDAKLTTEFADELLQEGIYVIGFSYPVVGKDLARIRVQLSACHSEQDVLNCVKAFEKVGKRRNLI